MSATATATVNARTTASAAGPDERGNYEPGHGEADRRRRGRRDRPDEESLRRTRAREPVGDAPEDQQTGEECEDRPAAQGQRSGRRRIRHTQQIRGALDAAAARRVEHRCPHCRGKERGAEREDQHDPLATTFRHPARVREREPPGEGNPDRAEQKAESEDDALPVPPDSPIPVPPMHHRARRPQRRTAARARAR